jgi:hypothetical protein
MEVSGQLHTPTALARGKKPRYPLDRRLGGLQIRSERGGEEKISCPYREPIPVHPPRSLVTTLNKVSRLLLLIMCSNNNMNYIFVSNVRRRPDPAKKIITVIHMKILFNS